MVWDGADGRKNASAQDGMEGGVVEHLTNRVFGKRRGVVNVANVKVLPVSISNKGGVAN